MDSNGNEHNLRKHSTKIELRWQLLSRLQYMLSVVQKQGNKAMVLHLTVVDDDEEAGWANR